MSEKGVIGSYYTKAIQQERRSMLKHLKMIAGIAYQDNKTKALIKRIPRNAVAVVCHRDIDALAAEGLIHSQVKAVINFNESMTGTYDHDGVWKLLEAGIPVFDAFGPKQDLDHQYIHIIDGELYVRNNGTYEKVAEVFQYSFNVVIQRKRHAWNNLSEQYRAFVNNSLTHAEKELHQFLHPIVQLSLRKKMEGKDVLIVARGEGYMDDLKAFKRLRGKKEVVIIAVDGGADGLLACRMKPDFIIGDMDSVSRKALTAGDPQLIVHRYLDGSSPGEVRLKQLGLRVDAITFVGTSEDVALIFSYWAKANKIYMIGTRSSMNEFLEKGRPGMGSSLLARIQAGHKIVDLKGIRHVINENDYPMPKLVALPAFLLFALYFASPKMELLITIILQVIR
ncbi:hypothetical protein KH400_14135 [Desertibacillus haloalkaliphilus]|nr:hypothetical protein [Desertibacillus haloalkaliphilus]